MSICGDIVYLEAETENWDSVAGEWSVCDVRAVRRERGLVPDPRRGKGTELVCGDVAEALERWVSDGRAGGVHCCSG